MHRLARTILIAVLAFTSTGCLTGAVGGAVGTGAGAATQASEMNETIDRAQEQADQIEADSQQRLDDALDGLGD